MALSDKVFCRHLPFHLLMFSCFGRSEARNRFCQQVGAPDTLGTAEQTDPGSLYNFAIAELFKSNEVAALAADQSQYSRTCRSRRQPSSNFS